MTKKEFRSLNRDTCQRILLRLSVYVVVTIITRVKYRAYVVNDGSSDGIRCFRIKAL